MIVWSSHLDEIGYENDYNNDFCYFVVIKNILIVETRNILLLL